MTLRKYYNKKIIRFVIFNPKLADRRQCLILILVSLTFSCLFLILSFNLVSGEFRKAFFCATFETFPAKASVSKAIRTLKEPVKTAANAINTIGAGASNSACATKGKAADG